MSTKFHISLPCKDLNKTIKFYTEELGLEIGRKTNNWADINLFSHQITFVTSDKFDFQYPMYSLEKDQLPSFHFGVILENDEWEKTYDRINKWSFDTIIKKTFFEDKKGEQSSFFIKDPNNYFLEFKTFKKRNEIFM
ncbi:VOC family protein [Tenacibaculum sp. M341]|uniref:VOC family protein n=1 Tax=Tenacibaculum sp. M341 TaxID=2530339 RepID=UPI001053FB62|nr:VOC family protein [Tenacibaculum sp. M341]TCI93701.1 bleomycin resistance protein [Tenacibaculum sp. M341]